MKYEQKLFCSLDGFHPHVFIVLKKFFFWNIKSEMNREKIYEKLYDFPD